MKKSIKNIKKKVILKSSYILIAIGIITVGIIGAFLLNQSNAANSYTLVKTEDFNSLNTAEWKVSDKTIFTRSKAIYMKDNMYLDGNGSLVIRTQRHCVPSTIDTSTSAVYPYVTSATASTAVCPSGQKPAYSSGYAVSTYRQKSGKIEIRAKIPTLQKGYWLGLWLRNQDVWGDDVPKYGELDISEIYGDNPNQNTATSHFGIYNKVTAKVQHANTDTNLANNWHVFTIEWDETGVSYYYDGKPVPTSNGNNDGDTNKDTQKDVASKGVTEQTFLDLMNQTWETRLEVQVLKGDQWHPSTDDTALFNPMLTYIDYIKYYDKGTSVLPDPTPTILPIPANISTTSSNGSITVKWDAVQGANNYTVRWGQNGVWNYSNSSGPEITTTSYTITGLTNDQTYDISVKAKDSTGVALSSDYSVPIQAVPNASQTTKLPAPTGLVAVVGNGQIKISWNGVTGANYYTVRWGQNGVWNYSNNPGPNITTTSYTITGLTNGTAYDIQVGARIESGSTLNSDYSATTTAIPKATSVTADINGDGTVGIFDLSILLSRWNSADTTCDFDKSGKVGIEDLSKLLSSWTK